MLYLAGKMTGLPEHGFPLFNQVADALRREGHTVINPAELDGGEADGPWDYYIRRDLVVLLCGAPRIQAIAVLPNWRDSKGACLEVHVAQALGLPVYAVQPDHTLKLLSETILEEAERVVNGARRTDYGTPLDNHTRTAQMWQAYFSRRAPDLVLTAEDVSLCNVLQKISRAATTGRITRDCLVDISGYARNVEMIQNERAGIPV